MQLEATAESTFNTQKPHTSTTDSIYISYTTDASGTSFTNNPPLLPSDHMDNTQDASGAYDLSFADYADLATENTSSGGNSPSFLDNFYLSGPNAFDPLNLEDLKESISPPTSQSAMPSHHASTALTLEETVMNDHFLQSIPMSGLCTSLPNTSMLTRTFHLNKVIFFRILFTGLQPT